MAFLKSLIKTNLNGRRLL